MARNEQLGHQLDELKTLRDEVAVKIHLAGMDAKDRWNDLRPRIDEVEAQAARAGDTAVSALLGTIDSLRGSLTDLKKRLESRSH
jgi:hypothetical protein